MEGKYVVGIMTVFVSVILVGSVLAPVIDNVSGGSWDEEITTVFNEDPDLTFTKQTSSFALDMSVTIDGSEITIVNGTDTITASYGIMFLYAADNSAVFINTADDLILTWSDADGSYSVNLAGSFTAAIADGKLTVDDGTAYDVPLPASYLYVPSSTGGYGSFPSGELAKRAEDPVIAAGSFAGAVGYNTSVTLVGDAMTIDVTGTDTEVTSVQWVKAAVDEPFDPSVITIQPFNPSTTPTNPVNPIDPIDLVDNDNMIMAVPTPTYTDGDWGYDLITTGYDDTVAKIVSYSGSGGVVTIPATIGGYEVKEIGKGGSGETIFSTSLEITHLIISEGIVKINTNAFRSCNKITGPLVFPDSLITIGSSSFYGASGFEGPLVIPKNVTSIGNNAFRFCSGLTSWILLEDVEISSAFIDTTNLKEVLNTSSLEITTTSYGLNADVVQDHIDAEAYLAPATLTYTIHHSGGGGGSQGAMYAAIPVVILIAILLAAVSMFLIRRAG